MDEQGLIRQYRGLVLYYVGEISARVPLWVDRDDLTSAGTLACYTPCEASTLPRSELPHLRPAPYPWGYLRRATPGTSNGPRRSETWDNCGTPRR